MTGLDGWDQRWFEKLPQWLLEEPKRKKVVRALEKGLEQFGSEVHPKATRRR